MTDGAVRTEGRHAAEQLAGSGRRRAWVIAGIVAVAVVAGGVIAVTISGDDDKPAAQTQSTLVTGPGLDTGGIELATLLANARHHTFHAKYEAQGSRKLLGGTLELEWWNTEGHSRIDTTRTTDGDVVRTSSIINGDEGVGCEKLGSAPWSCHPVEVPAPGDPNGMISTVTAQLSGRQVSEHRGKVNGFAARCFHVGGSGGQTDPIDICTDADGVMLRNATQDVAYEITGLDEDVPDSVFDPPAPVS